PLPLDTPSSCATIGGTSLDSRRIVMAASTTSSGQTVSTEKTELAQIVERFEAAWLRGEQPAIEDHLPECEAERRQLLIELVHIDLECRLKAREAVRVESYFERYPELLGNHKAVLELIGWEYRIRKLSEPTLSAEASAGGGAPRP